MHTQLLLYAMSHSIESMKRFNTLMALFRGFYLIDERRIRQRNTISVNA